MKTFLQFAPIAGDNGFAQEGWWIWCPSVIQGPDGRWHMFASRWPAWLPMHPGWMTNSQVVRAVADRPEGPYTFAEVVLPARGPEYWDGCSTHNPTIREHGGRYYLFYTGITSPLLSPQPGEPFDTRDPRCVVARSRKRVGVAWADSLEGPWHRSDQPLIEVKPRSFYSFLTSNPSPWIFPDGRTVMLFKSRAWEGHSHSAMMIGLATADAPEGPYAVKGEEPLFGPGRFGELEDPFFWHDGERFHVIAKDMSGQLTGEHGNGFHGVSADAVHWEAGEPSLAYRREIPQVGGELKSYGSLERPFLLFQNGRATHLCAAVSDGSMNFTDASRTWNLVIPLQQ